MDLSPYVEQLRRELADAASTGDSEARDIAERLARALDPAAQMMLLEALSDASAELTGELADTSVEVRMRGREPQFVVQRLHAEPESLASDEHAGQVGDMHGDGDGYEDEDDAVARVTVRIPESLKVRAEELASSGSQSLNAWIVQAIRFATRERAITPPQAGGAPFDLDLGSRLFTASSAGHGAPPGPGGPARTSRRVKGWSR